MDLITSCLSTNGEMHFGEYNGFELKVVFYNMVFIHEWCQNTGQIVHDCFYTKEYLKFVKIKYVTIR